MDSEKEIYISFLEAIISTSNTDDLFEKTLTIIQKLFNCERTQIWKKLDGINHFSIEYEFAKENPLLAQRVIATGEKKDEIYTEIKDLDSCFTNLGINFLCKANISSNKTLVLCFKDKNKKFSNSEVTLLQNIANQYKLCFPKREKCSKDSDNNERLQQQNQILREKDRLRTDFINNISHELRTPLSSVLGFSNMLVSNKNIPEKEEREIAKQIYEAANRLSNLITDFLEISRIDSDSWTINSETIDIGDLIKKSIDEFSSLNKDYEIKYEISSNYPLMKTDPRLVRQVVDNLISNAIKYSYKNKKILIQLSANETEVKISVIDNGVGISEEELPKIFTRFFRSSNENIKNVSGTGLGLAICKSIIESLNGKINVESNLDKGSKFTIELPV